eukprot:CAMPEP_0185184502 /NCGR_PEP_ID=MMETSP1140-20130426/2622_1 /TAXON_ID=298111 /ORGANISM="Pavlova sp., Strain CCMP459" /LENGTH=345 /DNA_ID=CAMNT_0027750581 /DNA_START=270 /DNA_END=1309 /DNA_ORIENTATION=+
MPLLLKTIRAWRCLAAIPPAAAIDNSAAVLDKLQDEGIAVLGPADRRHATTVVSRAFAGTPKSEPEPMADWILGPALADYGDPRREELLRFFLAFEVLNAAPQCRSWWHALMPGPAAFEAAPGRVRGEGAWGRVMLGARGPGGELEAVVIAQRMERPPAGITAAAQKVGAICRFAWSGLGALPTVLRPALYARVGRPCLHRAQDIALPTMDALHAEHSAGGEHWYVAFMAVDPAAQGGATAAASRARGRIADADRLDSLLVCNGNRNKTVYERLGYIAVGDTSFVDDTQPAHSSASTPPPMYVMKRSVSGIVNDLTHALARHPTRPSKSHRQELAALVTEAEGSL